MRKNIINQPCYFLKDYLWLRHTKKIKTKLYLRNFVCFNGVSKEQIIKKLLENQFLPVREGEGIKRRKKETGYNNRKGYEGALRNFESENSKYKRSAN